MVETTKPALSTKPAYWDGIFTTFEDLELKSMLLKAIYECGLERPVRLQEKIISDLLNSKHLVVTAPSGSGKTTSYTITMLQMIDEKKPEVQALVLVPTREMGMRVVQVFKLIGQFLKVSVTSCVGGVDLKEVIQALKEGVQVVVGTPGRVMDMQRKGHLDLKNLKILALDETDEIFARGFLDQLKDIFQVFPLGVQISSFASTQPTEVLELAKQFMTEPRFVQEKPPELTIDGIKQYYVAIDIEEWKFETLIEIYNNIGMNLQQRNLMMK